MLWLLRVEDPYLSGQYAVSFVQGFERNPQDPTHLQASACCKHYAANSMEDTTEGGVKLSRHTIDANITQQDLIDSYLGVFAKQMIDGDAMDSSKDIILLVGLGVLVLRGIRSLELGVGLLSGLGIVLLAIILDRVTKAALARINVSQSR